MVVRFRDVGNSNHIVMFLHCNYIDGKLHSPELFSIYMFFFSLA